MKPLAKTKSSEVMAGAGPLLFFFEWRLVTSFSTSLMATGTSRARRISHAFFTAAPFRSVPHEAAVAEVFEAKAEDYEQRGNLLGWCALFGEAIAFPPFFFFRSGRLYRLHQSIAAMIGEDRLRLVQSVRRS